MTGDAVVRRTDGIRWLRAPTSSWSVLRIVLLGVWMTSAVLSWWVAPRHAAVAVARADLAAGRVESYQWGDSWDTRQGKRWGPAETPVLRSSGAQGPLFVWRTADWRIHYAVTDTSSGEYTLGDDIDLARYSGPEAASLDQAAASAGLTRGFFDDGPPQPALKLITLLLWLSFLVLLTAGPAPVIGTRWYWFWLVPAVPFGLGLLYWLIRERPWSLTAQAPVAPAGREARRRWYVGLAVGVVTGLVGSVLVYALNRALGDWLVPNPSG